MALKYKWRQFRPKQVTKLNHKSSHEMLGLLHDADHAYEFSQNLKTRNLPVGEYGEVAKYHMQLIAQTPRAVLAQQQMDAHKHGFHHREKRLYELIDFNDSFVSYILALPDEKLPGIVEQLHDEMSRFCKRLRTPMFSERQFEAIVHGLSREIAVFRGARAEGFNVAMTSRTEDAFGIDMVITESETEKQINLDCKTSRAYHYRLEEFVREDRLSRKHAEVAEETDFVTVPYHRDNQSVAVTTMCIRTERLGEIKDFQFSQTDELGRLIKEVLKTIKG